MDWYLKNKYLMLVLIGVVGIGFLFSACESPSEVLLSPFDEEKAYFEFVMKNDDFFRSEEEVLNDPDNNITEETAVSNGKNVIPRFVVRRVRGIDRTFSFEFINDTVAIVTMTRTMDVRLWVQGNLKEPDDQGVHHETKFYKDFTETATRKARFVKVNNTRTPEDDWQLVSVSLLEGGTPERDFDIIHLNMEFPGDRSFEYDDPLETFMRVGLGPREVPVVSLSNFRQDGFKIEITLQSYNPEPEILYLRHGGGLGAQIGDGGYTRRLQAPAPLSEEVVADGLYLRTYVINWNSFIQLHGVDAPIRGENIRRGRFSTIVEAVSYESLHNTETPVQTNYWGVPFIIE